MVGMHLRWTVVIDSHHSKNMIFFRLGALAIFAIVVVRMYRLWRSSTIRSLGSLAFFISVIGMLGFLDVAWIDLLPSEFLNRFELPNDPFQGVRLTAPDGRVYIISPPIARVQRYGPEGFETAFTYVRKAFKFGMSASGNILICASTSELLTYSPDGK